MLFGFFDKISVILVEVCFEKQFEIVYEVTLGSFLVELGKGLF